MYLHRDRLGSPSTDSGQALTEVTDEDGSLVGRARYDAYGRILSNTIPLMLTTRLYAWSDYDPETGLYKIGARWYDPQLGLWLTPDSVVPDVNNPIAWNRYAFNYQNPVQYVDPSGHFVWDLLDIGSFFLSARNFFRSPSWANLGWWALDAVSLLPLIPGLGWARHGDAVARVTVEEAADRATRQFAEQTGTTAAVALRPRAEVWGPLEGFVRAKQAGEKNLPLIGKLPGGLRIVRTTKGFPIALRVSDVDVAFGMIRTESGWRRMIPREIKEWNDLFNTAYDYKMAVHGDLMTGRAKEISGAMRVSLDEMSTIFFSDAPGMPFQNTTQWLYEAFLGSVP